MSNKKSSSSSSQSGKEKPPIIYSKKKTSEYRMVENTETGEEFCEISDNTRSFTDFAFDPEWQKKVVVIYDTSTKSGKGGHLTEKEKAEIGLYIHRRSDWGEVRFKFVRDDDFFRHHHEYGGQCPFVKVERVWHRTKKIQVWNIIRFDANGAPILDEGDPHDMDVLAPGLGVLPGTAATKEPVVGSSASSGAGAMSGSSSFIAGAAKRNDDDSSHDDENDDNENRNYKEGDDKVDEEQRILASQMDIDNAYALNIPLTEWVKYSIVEKQDLIWREISSQREALEAQREELQASARMQQELVMRMSRDQQQQQTPAHVHRQNVGLIANVVTLSTLSGNDIKNFMVYFCQLRQNDPGALASEWMTKNILRQIKMRVKAREFAQYELGDDRIVDPDINSWSLEKLEFELKRLCVDDLSIVGRVNNITMMSDYLRDNLMKKFPDRWEMLSSKVMDAWGAPFAWVSNNFHLPEAEHARRDELLRIKELVKRSLSKDCRIHAQIQLELDKTIPPLQSEEDIQSRVLRIVARVQATVDNARLLGYEIKEKSESAYEYRHPHENKRPRIDEGGRNTKMKTSYAQAVSTSSSSSQYAGAASSSNQQHQLPPKPKCKTCGWRHDQSPGVMCRFITHPGSNKSDLPWDESVVGQQYARVNGNAKGHLLPKMLPDGRGVTQDPTTGEWFINTPPVETPTVNSMGQAGSTSNYYPSGGRGRGHQQYSHSGRGGRSGYSSGRGGYGGGGRNNQHQQNRYSAPSAPQQQRPETEQEKNERENREWKAVRNTDAAEEWYNREGKHLRNDDEIYCSVIHKKPKLNHQHYLIPIRILPIVTDRVIGPTLSPLQCKAFVDNGAVGDSYISIATSQLLIQSGSKLIESRGGRICSAFKKDCCNDSLGRLMVNISFSSEINNKQISFDINCCIADILFDLIIGRPVIGSQCLTEHLPSQFGAVPVVTESERTDHPSTTPIADPDIAATTVTKRDILGLAEEDDDGILEDDNDDTEMWLVKEPPGLSPIPTALSGSPRLIERLKTLCLEYKEIFSRTLRDEPANLPPFTVEVDTSKWETRKNQTACRQQSPLQNQEIKTQIEKLLKCKAIRYSQAAHYSQVLLVKKPEVTPGVKEWRFCNDYRSINEVSTSNGWPIPNIPQMLRRIGDHKPKIFGVLDMNKGFNQMAVSERCRKYFAFITFMGIFEWNRLPMGPKGGPSFFQQMMATKVLIGLIYQICEVYMDDVIVHATNEDEFVERLTQIFKRFKDCNLTMNPDKVKLGLPEVEYTGHVINQHGLTFSRERIQNLLNIPLPSVQRELKAFLGLANYLRDHITNHSITVRPLNQMLLQYNPRKELVWSDLARDAFKLIREKVENLPTIFFMSTDVSHPVNVLCDASDYGMGAEVTQTVDGVKRYIAILSQSFTDVQFRWSTPEKEGYAIYLTLKKLQYLLRDIRFSLQTDHKNLTFIRDSGSQKVLRWKYLIQEFDFYLSHIKGDDNIVADALSRLCPASALSRKIDSDSIEKLNEEEAEEVFLSLIVPRQRMPEAIYRLCGQIHNSVSGHFGVDITLERAVKLLNELDSQVINPANRISREYLREYIRMFIRRCPCCQKMSHLKSSIQTTPFTLAAYRPMKRWYIDSIGPIEADMYGNKYIHVIIDACTRWLDLAATVSCSAADAVKPIMEAIGTFGCPSEITSDNGSQYVNAVIRELMKLLCVEHTRTTAYSKEENGIVERSNLETMRHLRAMVFANTGNIRTWSRQLPLVRRIFNSTKHSATGISPSEYVFGKSIDTQRGMLLPFDSDIRMSADAKEMLAEQVNVIAAYMNNARDAEVVRVVNETPPQRQRRIRLQIAAAMLASERQSEHAKLTKAARRVQRATDKTRVDKSLEANTEKQFTEFEDNSFVLLEWPTGPPSKLMARKKGPYRVTKSVGADVTIKDLSNGKEMVVHINRLTPFIFDENRINPLEIAIKDKKEHFLEKIISHRGNLKGLKGNLYFTVKWLGYDDPSDNTEEPYANVREAAPFHEWCIANNARRLIPERFR